MKKKMNKVFMVCVAATAMTAGMSVSAFAQVHIGGIPDQGSSWRGDLRDDKLSNR